MFKETSRHTFEKGRDSVRSPYSGLRYSCCFTVLDMLAKAIDEHLFTSDKICIVDESNITVNLKGQKNSCMKVEVKLVFLALQIRTEW